MSEEEREAVSTEEQAGAEKEATGAPEGETEQKDESATSEAEKAESESESAEEDTGETEEKEEKPKKKGGFQRRIEKLNARRAAAEAEAEYWRQRALAEKPKQDDAVAPADKPKPKPEDFSDGAGGYDYAGYAEALTDWKAEKKIQEFEARQEEKSKASSEKSEQEKQAEAYLEKERAFAESHDDYDEAAQTAIGALAESRGAGAKALGQAITAAENGPELLYHLGQNPDEARRIARLSPQQAVMALGGFAARIAGDQKQPEGKPPPAPVSNAPKPPTPVKKPTGTATPSPDSPDSDRLSTEEWYRLYGAQKRR
jgi:hypothetical protein